MVELLRRDKPDLIAPDLWSPNSQDLNHVHTESGCRLLRLCYTGGP